MAFTDYETEQLRRALLKETRRCAVTLGMKKTSVDQLTKAVGIAKGSFYKFYESKELLFLAVLEDIHSELYETADRVLSENAGLSPPKRAAEAVLAVCKRLSDTDDMVFIEHDAKLLLQRLPEAVKKEHYHDGGNAHPKAFGEAWTSSERWGQVGGRDGARFDFDGFSQGANRGAVSAGAGNAGMRSLQGAI